MKDFEQVVDKLKRLKGSKKVKLEELQEAVKQKVDGGYKVNKMRKIG